MGSVVHVSSGGFLNTGIKIEREHVSIKTKTYQCVIQENIITLISSPVYVIEKEPSTIIEDLQVHIMIMTHVAMNFQQGKSNKMQRTD